MRKSLRAIVLALTAGLLGVTLAVVPPTLAPDQHAHALCYSSISPSCQPGNIPILMNLGIIKPPVAPLPGGVPGYAQIGNLTNGVSQLTLSGTIGALGTLIAGLWSGFAGGSSGKTTAVLTEQGLQGLLMKTDPLWNATPEYPTYVNNTNCLAWATSERPVPFQSLFPPALDCEALDDFEVLLYRISGSGSNGFPQRIEILSDSVRVTNLYSRPSVGVPAPQIRKWCWNPVTEAYLGPTGYTLNMTNAAGNSVTSTFACPAGAVYHGTTLRGNFHYIPPDTAASSYLVLHSTVGGGRVAPSGVTAGAGTASGVFDVVVKCMAPSGPYEVTVSVPFSVTSGDMVQLPDVVCDEGDLAVGGGLTVTTPGNPPEVLIDPDVNDVIPEISDLPTLYPDCFGPSALACELRLERKNGETWDWCGPIAAYCPTWAQTPEPALSIDYRCKFGPYIVDISMCSAFRSPSHGLLPNTNDDGSPIHPHAPVPGGVGLPLLTLDGQPWPEGTPWPGTGSGAFPGGGELPDKVPQNCWPEGWGVLNPISWVFEPVRCALEWAFVPRQEVVTIQAAQLNTAWSTTPPVVVALFIEDLLNDSPNLSGCEGPRIYFDVTLGGHRLLFDEYPMSACDEPGATLAGLSRLISALVMYWSGLVAISRYLGGTLGFPQFGSTGSTP